VSLPCHRFLFHDPFSIKNCYAIPVHVYTMPYTIARAICMHDYDMLPPSHGGSNRLKHKQGRIAGFKMDYFKGMSYDDIRPIFEAKFNSNVAFLQKIKEQINEKESRALKRINETPAEKAAKRKKLDDEVEVLKRYLQIVPNEEVDVYTEATPLALKAPVVDHEIHNENNRPYYKIKRDNGSQQLYLSFLSLHRNVDRENLEALWRSVKERFATTKPKNLFDDFLLITLGEMFKKPDIHAQI
nr:hypothetical protein [Tanacetum cinerariifolium]